MRDIKYRQWLGVRFRYWGFIDGAANTFRSPTDLDVKSDQFTGLKDKNGKDIYEGDIVEQERNCLFDDGKHYQEVSFNNEDQFVSGSCSLYQAVNSFGAEVIGNIYENKELLETK